MKNWETLLYDLHHAIVGGRAPFARGVGVGGNPPPPLPGPWLGPLPASRHPIPYGVDAGSWPVPLPGAAPGTFDSSPRMRHMRHAHNQISCPARGARVGLVFTCIVRTGLKMRFQVQEGYRNGSQVYISEDGHAYVVKYQPRHSDTTYLK